MQLGLDRIDYWQWGGRLVAGVNPKYGAYYPHDSRRRRYVNRDTHNTRALIHTS